MPAPATNNGWILDSGASHHITHDLNQLHLSTPYSGVDQLVVVDGTALPISHTGNSSLQTPTQTLHLSDILHVPSIAQNLLSVSKLCNTNLISIEFFSDQFLVKDLKSGTTLIKGINKNGLYHIPAQLTPHAFITTTTPPWHHIFGHPSH